MHHPPFSNLSVFTVQLTNPPSPPSNALTPHLQSGGAALAFNYLPPPYKQSSDWSSFIVSMEMQIGVRLAIKSSIKVGYSEILYINSEIFTLLLYINSEIFTLLLYINSEIFT